MIVFLDYLNSNQKSSYPYDKYDISFDEFCCILEEEIQDLKESKKMEESEEIDFSDVNHIFKFKFIDVVMNGFVGGYYKNDTLWFEEINTNKIILSISDDMK